MRSIGVTILAVMGGIWWLAGLGFGGALGPLPTMAGVAAVAVLVAVARALPNDGMDEAERRRRGKLIAWASALEGAAIFVSNNVLINIGAASYILCGMAVIVGAHFLPLARGLRVPVYYVTASVLLGLGGVGCLVGDPAQRNLLVGLGSAVVLWASGGWIAVNARTAHPA